MSTKVIDLTSDPATSSSPDSYACIEKAEFIVKPLNTTQQKRSETYIPPPQRRTPLAPLQNQASATVSAQPSQLLTSSSSSNSNSNSNSIQLPRLADLNRPRAGTDALHQAIDGMDVTCLRYWVKQYAERDASAARVMREKYLVRGTEVVRYHRDDESEDDGPGHAESDMGDEEEEEEEDSDGEDDEDDEDAEEKEDREKVKVSRPIAIGDDELVPRIATCENCEREFDVTINNRGDCRWHDGEKEVDDSNDFWADHDEDCHGLIESFKDDPDLAEGFMWSCCERMGSDRGCHSTKHKAPINQIISEASSSLPNVSGGVKRKADYGWPTSTMKRATHSLGIH